MGRIYFTLDLENLLEPSRREGHLAAFIDRLVAKVRGLGARGTMVGGVAVGDRDLQVRTAWQLDDVGIRVHAPENHGPDASDLVLIDYLDHALPGSVDTVVIGSGDHIFAPVAGRLKREGLRIEILALPGHVSNELYRAAHGFIPFTDAVAHAA